MRRAPLQRRPVRRPLGRRGELPAAAALLLALFAAGAAGASESDTERVATDSLRIDFSPIGARPTLWEACYPTCDETRSSAALGADASSAALELSAPGDPALGERLRGLRYELSRRREAGGERLDFASEPLEPGVRVEKTYWIPWRGYSVTTEVRIRGPRAAQFVAEHRLALSLAGGTALESRPADAPRGAAEEPRWISVQDGSVRELSASDAGTPFAAGSWSGARTRFWAFLARSSEGGELLRVDRDRLELAPGQLCDARIELYSGPLDYRLLDSVDPQLTGLIFSHLWFWLRWLCLAMLWLLDALAAVFENAGASIILLSVVVKILLRPITSVAERWQAQVEATKARLEPELRRIRSLYRGEEQSRQLLELHRATGVHPLYGLKGALGLLLQIPVFFAAYHTLDEAFLVHGQRFLWIADLAQPDRVAALPFRLPLLGDGLHALPFLMTAVTLLASRLHRSTELAPAALRNQRRGLYAMAAAFFVLFYAFPAAMVLYWTTNGVALMLREQWVARSAGALPARAGAGTR